MFLYRVRRFTRSAVGRIKRRERWGEGGGAGGWASYHLMLPLSCVIPRFQMRGKVLMKPRSRTIGSRRERKGGRLPSLLFGASMQTPDKAGLALPFPSLPSPWPSLFSRARAFDCISTPMKGRDAPRLRGIPSRNTRRSSLSVLFFFFLC